jgi:plasmid maintenance system antidote protein VapI
LANLVKERRAFEPRFGFHKLAEAARIQKPYMSKVMGGKANLSADQIYSIGTYLELTKEEQQYLQLCLEAARTGIASRKQELLERMEEIANQHRDSSEHLSSKIIETEDTTSPMADYYLDPMVQIVHVALAIPRYSKSPMTLAQDLGIPGPHMHSIVTILERTSLVVREGYALIPRDLNLHLPKSSPLYRAWRNQLKLLSLQKLNAQEVDEGTYSFSTVFTCTETTRKKIHAQFLEFLKSCETSVKDAAPKRLYQMSFDLFSWAPGEP